MIYAVIITILFRSLNLTVSAPIWDTLDSLSKGLVPLALVTLGAQLAETKVKFKILNYIYQNFKVNYYSTFSICTCEVISN